MGPRGRVAMTSQVMTDAPPGPCGEPCRVAAVGYFSASHLAAQPFAVMHAA